MKNLRLAALAAVFFCGHALAYRPFDGTDAGVADPGTWQLELGASGLRQGSMHSYALPQFTLTYGLTARTEVAVEARMNRARDGTGAPYHDKVQDAAIVAKHLLREGSLQEKDGPSLAFECALLLPHAGGESAGAGCAGLVSQQWEAATGHVNVGVERTPERLTNRFLSLMLEGPGGWKVRPVGELRWEDDNTGGWERSLLAGVVIPAGKHLAFDLALRAGRGPDGMLHEARVGLTWNFGAQ